MTDRPILFSTSMIRALLAGRKTQTRRLCSWANNPLSPALTYIVACDEPGWFGDEEGEVQFKVPFALGDRLWVREAWKPHSAFDAMKPRDMPVSNVFYLADDRYSPSGSRGRPGMHMPRWASRLTLTVTEVRVERLQDISEADALAEGIYEVRSRAGDGMRHFGTSLSDSVWPTATRAYRNLWEGINGPDAWDANPWIVAVSFDVARRNIDAEAPSA